MRVEAPPTDRLAGWSLVPTFKERYARVHAVSIARTRGVYKQ